MTFLNLSAVKFSVKKPQLNKQILIDSLGIKNHIFILKRNGNESGKEGVTGLKELGVRDLNYRLVFLAYHVLGSGGAREEETPETMKEMVRKIFDFRHEKVFKILKS